MTDALSARGQVKRVVALTGGAGYIGSVLARLLVKRGFSVRIIDMCFFGNPFVDEKEICVVKRDVRSLSSSDLAGVSAVIDLAAISNDPAGDLDEKLTLEINFQARKRLQELCVAIGVERYILASSCSVYGYNDVVVTEESRINPLTTYAQTNRLAEESAMALSQSDTTFSAVRQATVYGPSSRMRYDLVVNAMVLDVLHGKPIKILRDGKQWRPLVHVADASRAILAILEAEPDKVNGQIFNVGSDDQNMNILELAELIPSVLGKTSELEWYGEPEHRSYRVSFEKIRNIIGFEPERTVAMAVKEIESGLAQGNLVARPESYTLPWYRSLLADGLLK